MDPLTIIAGALVAGAAAGATSVATDAVKDAYAALRQMIVDFSGQQTALASAIAQAEQKPASQARQEVLKEELNTAGVAADARGPGAA